MRYIPKARPLEDDPSFWQTVGKQTLGKWLELDLYQYVDENVEKFINTLQGNTVDGGAVFQDLRQIALGG